MATLPFTDFVLAHAQEDVTRLLLGVKAWPVPDDPVLSALDARELAVRTIEARRKLARKAPDWFACEGLVYPTALCAQQCSSSATAAYKAALARRILPSHAAGRIADLTGGLGVDTVAFSRIAAEVLYIERDPALVAAARHNFPLLGAGNVQIRQGEVSADGIATLLGGFVPDLVFLDPARRSEEGRKVFLLEECSPDVLQLLPGWFSVCPHLLLKLSPMADVSMACERLCKAWEKAAEQHWNQRIVREVHIVSTGGECRELLLWLDRGFDGEPSLTCAEDGHVLRFSHAQIESARPVLPDAPYGKRLFEPGKSLTKAGAANALCERYPLVKLARFTHLFFADALSAEQVSDLSPMGRFYAVKEIVPFSKAAFRDIRKRYPQAEVSARNLPLSSDELRARLGVDPGGTVHLFGVRMEMPHAAENFLLVGKKIPNFVNG